MRARILTTLAYAGAGLTLVIAIGVPFYLMGELSQVVAHAGLHVDATYGGGTVARTYMRDGYSVSVYAPVRPHRLQRTEPFVQVAFAPAAALPTEVTEAIDLDGNGQPDVRVHFATKGDAQGRLSGEVVALNDKYMSLPHVGQDSFSRLLVRSENRVLLRVPLSNATRN